MPIILAPPTATEALATIDELEDRLGRSLTDEEAARALTLLVDASATVRRIAGQQFILSTSTWRGRPRCGVLRLPERPVLAVTAVTTVTGAAVAFTWDGLGQNVDVAGGCYPIGNLSWSRRREAPLDVTYEHGYEPIPDDIIGLVCQVVMRCLGIQPTDGAVEGENIASYSYRLRDTAASGAKGLLPDEKAIALAYRLPSLPIRML